MNIDLYNLLNQVEKDQVCECISEALARAYGTDAVDDYDWDFTCTKLEDN